jgi:predicted nuclease with TOPRIM domain
MEPKTIEELQQENEQLTTENEELKKVNENLASENQSLKEEVETVTAVNDELQLKVEELSTIAPSEPTAKSSESKPVLPTSTFEVHGETYRFISPVFMYKGQRFTAEAALQDYCLLAQLVDAQSGCIIKA